MIENSQETLYQQETEFQIINLLLPHLQNKTFIDIGAEKGAFAKFLVENALTGILIEPLPKHEKILRKIATQANCPFLPLAIDNTDRMAEFYIACDSSGEPLDYFHSLHPLDNDARINHQKKITVTCKTLNTLLHEGIIEKKIGIIKTDTEGNDLHVLEGMNELEAEIIVCEFFMPGIYSGWEQGCPYQLITAARQLGFNHFIAVKRIDQIEFVSIDSDTFVDKQWGNLIFIHESIFIKTKNELLRLLAEIEKKLINAFSKRATELQSENELLRATCEERLELINKLNRSCAEPTALIKKLNNALEQKEALLASTQALLKEKNSMIKDAQVFIDNHIKYRLKNQIHHKLKTFLIPKIFKIDLKTNADPLKQNEIIQAFLNFSKESDNEVQLLQEIAVERYELIQRLHSEVNSNKNMNILRLLFKQLNEFLKKLTTFYDTLQEKFLILDINKNAHFKDYEIALQKVHSLIQETIIQYQETYKKINYEKEITFIHNYQHRTVKERIEKIKTLIKSAFTPKLGTLIHYPPRKIDIPPRYQKKLKNIKNLPVISLVTPTFNQGIYLERTINSIIEQDYANLEYIIQDGGSTDSTLEVIKTYGKKIKRWESVKDEGQSNALNVGFSHTTGEIMAYLNSDDLLLPGALHYIGNYFRQHPKIDVVYGHRILIDEKDLEIGRWILPPHDSRILSWADYIPQETLFWRRRLWEKAGGYIDENYCFAMDWDLLLRFRDAGARFARLPRFMGAFRIHPHQKTSANIIQTGMEEMQRLRTRCHKRNMSYQEISTAIKPYLYKHVIYHRLYRAGLLRY